jgi:hypothetical protein
VEIIEKIVADNDPKFDESKLKIDCDMNKENEYDWEEYPDGSKVRILPFTEDQFTPIEKLSIEEDLFNEMRPFMEKANGKPFEKFEIVHHEIYHLQSMYYKVKVQITEEEYFHGLIRRMHLDNQHEEMLCLTHFEPHQERHSRFKFMESSLIKNFILEYKTEWEPPDDQPEEIAEEFNKP